MQLLPNILYVLIKKNQNLHLVYIRTKGDETETQMIRVSLAVEL